ncbi:MAG: Gx transporter family protein [Elusimicrobiota bacterium]
MTQSVTKEYNVIAFLAASASVFQIMESFIPHPIAGVRLGLANMITLIALVTLGFRAALEIAVIRTLISSFVLGTFLSPSFILSFSGAVASAAVMGLAFRLTTLTRRVLISVVGISLIGSIVNNLTQISVVYLLLIKNKGIFFLIPWLGVSAVVMGWLNGIIAARVLKELQEGSHKTASDNVILSPPGHPPRAGRGEESRFQPFSVPEKESPFHLIAPEIKIFFAVILSLVIVVSNNFFLYVFVVITGSFIIYLAGISLSAIFLTFRKISSFILCSFFLPLSFNFSVDGLYEGLTPAVRITLLAMVSIILVNTTSPEQLTKGLGKIVSLRFLELLMNSWAMLPSLWEKIHLLVKSKIMKRKSLKETIASLVFLITAVWQIETQ